MCAGGGEEGDEGEGGVSMCTGGRTSVWRRCVCACVYGALQGRGLGGVRFTVACTLKDIWNEVTPQE